MTFPSYGVSIFSDATETKNTKKSSRRECGCQNGLSYMGGIAMSEKMLVTQALDERDLLVKKIRSRIENPAS